MVNIMFLENGASRMFYTKEEVSRFSKWDKIQYLLESFCYNLSEDFLVMCDKLKNKVNKDG